MKLYRSRMPGVSLAFTLVELLAVMAIVAMLTALTIAGIGKVSAYMHSVKTQSNLRSIGQGIELYTQDHKLYYPSIYTNNDKGFFAWMHLLDYEGYIDDGIAVMSSAGKITTQRYLQRLYNPTTRDLYPDVFNSGGYGLNGFYTTAALAEDAVGNGEWNRHINVQEILYPSKTVLAADGNAGTNGKMDAALLDFRGYAYYPNTLSGGAAHYLFCDLHVECIDAQDPSQMNSPPVGYGTDVFFNPSQYP